MTFSCRISFVLGYEKILLSPSVSFRGDYQGIAKFGYGIGADFGNLLQFIDNAKSIEGDFVEIGCFMGSSTCVMANYISGQNKIAKKLFVYDYFNGFTYEEAQKSIDNSWVDTHVTDGRDRVCERIQARLKNVDELFVYQRNIIQEDALREVAKISFANIDVDIYEAVYAALIQVHEKLSVNGIIVVEDAGHTPRLLGAKVALENFLDMIGRDIYHLIQMESGQYVLIKRYLI